MHCGGCDMACGPMGCALGICRDSCLPPLVRCGPLCLNVQTDPDNCGGCGRVCESGICVDGMCSGAFPGHLVVIGHDYRRSRTGQNYIAGNSVILLSNSLPSDVIEVVVYEGDATAESIRGVDAAIDQVATRGAETGSVSPRRRVSLPVSWIPPMWRLFTTRPGRPTPLSRLSRLCGGQLCDLILSVAELSSCLKELRWWHSPSAAGAG